MKFLKKNLAVLIFASIAIWGFLPVWGFCMDACQTSGAINLGVALTGIGLAALTLIGRTASFKAAPGGCGLMVVAAFGAPAVLGFLISANGWNLLALGFPVLLGGLVLFIIGFIKYTSTGNK